MKVNFLNSVEEVPEKIENTTLILYFIDGEIVATQDWRMRHEEIVEIYNYSKHWYDSYIVKNINKIILLEEEVA